MRRVSVSRTAGETLIRFLESAAGDVAELLAVCIFIGVIGVWARLLSRA